MLWLTILLASVAHSLRPPDVAIVGGTIVDVSHHRGAPRDRDDRVILIRGGRVRAILPEERAAIRHGAVIVDAHGGCIVPGLIDGFGAVRNESFADAYLYDGVTTVVVPLATADGGEGEDRVVTPKTGPEVLRAVPISGHSPTGSIASPEDWCRGRFRGPALGLEALGREVTRVARGGGRVVWAAPDLSPSQVRAVIEAAHRSRMAVVAEHASSTYVDGLKAGVDVFARNDYYGVALASPSDFGAYAADPLGPGARPAMRTICGEEPFAAAARRFGEALAASGTRMMPALSMEATADDVGGPNPWTAPSAVLVSPADVDDPVDRATGARPYLVAHADRAHAIRRCALRKQELDRELHASGASYVAGSSAPSYGVLPGSGLHAEIRLLQRIGLTPREALSAATVEAAAAFRLRDRGSVRVGGLADIVILNRDPRSDAGAVDHVRTVIFHGRPVDRAALIEAARQRRGGGNYES